MERLAVLSDAPGTPWRPAMANDAMESNEVAKEPLEPLSSPSTCREEAEVVVKVVDV